MLFLYRLSQKYYYKEITVHYQVTVSLSLASKLPELYSVPLGLNYWCQ